MSEYMKFYDEAPRWLRVVLAVVWVPAFLYRLFGVIIDKAKDTPKLVYLILNVVPIIGFIIVIIDIVWCAMGRPLPVSFASLNGDVTEVKKEEAVEAEEVKEEEKPEAKEEKPEDKPE